jgi:hypothetical protein
MPKLIMPVRVYLDSSDFSRLSEELPPEDPLVELRKNLFELRNAGACEFRYSLVHVCEMAPVELSSLAPSIRRLGLAQDLCGARCFRTSDQIDRRELLSALTSQDAPADLALGDDADWLPETDFLDKHAEAFLKDAEAVRAHSKQRGVRDPKTVNLAVRMLMLQQLQRYAQKLPTNQLVRDGVVRLALGRANKEALVAVLAKGFADLRQVADWMANTQPGRDVAAVLRERAMRPLAELQRLRALLQELISVSESPRMGRQKGASSIRRGAASALEEYRNPQIRSIFEANREWFAGHGVRVENMPASLDEIPMTRLDTLIELYTENIRLNASTDRDLSDATSDMPDILHATYLPYVDVFRADVFATQVARKQADKFGVRLVQRLEDLPDAIREEASKRLAASKGE